MSGLVDSAWLSAILLSLVALFLSLTWKHTGAVDPVVVEMVFYAGIFRLLWLKRERLALESDHVSTVLGLLLVSFTLLRCLAVYWFESFFLKLAPPLGFLGVALLASGFKRLPQYWREGLILGLMVFPTIRLWPFAIEHLHIQAVVAKIAAFQLHYLGCDVAQQGTRLVLPVGAVDVWVGCSGLAMTLLLLQFALLFVLVLPLRPRQRWAVLLAAIALGIFLGSMRVALIALSLPDSAKFYFWHDEPGAQIFSTLAIVLLFLFCRFIARPKPAEAAAHG